MADNLTSAAVRCPHCNNTVPHTVLAYHSLRDQWIPVVIDDVVYDGPENYEILRCLTCKSLSAWLYRCQKSRPHRSHYECISHPRRPTLLGVPERIAKLLEASEHHTDPSYIGVQMGKVLEGVCRHLGAEKGTLDARISSLAASGRLPNALVPVAHSIRMLRNYGAHDDDVELTADEVPLMLDLVDAILAQVFQVPALVERATARLDALKK